MFGLKFGMGMINYSRLTAVSIVSKYPHTIVIMTTNGIELKLLPGMFIHFEWA